MSLWGQSDSRHGGDSPTVLGGLILNVSNVCSLESCCPLFLESILSFRLSHCPAQCGRFLCSLSWGFYYPQVRLYGQITQFFADSDRTGHKRFPAPFPPDSVTNPPTFLVVSEPSASEILSDFESLYSLSELVFEELQSSVISPKLKATALILIDVVYCFY